MAKSESESEEDQRSKGAQNAKPAQSSAEDAEESSKAPSRVHIFKDKSPAAIPSKSDSEPLKCSLVRGNRPIGFGSEHDAGDVAMISAGVQMPTFDFMDEFIRLKDQIQIGKKALYDAAMRAEDLDAMIQGLRRTRARIFRRGK